MHLGQIVALDTPERLRAALGDELVELRVEGHGSDALALLRDRGVAGPDAFAVGSTLTVPLANRRAGEAIAAIERLGLGVASLSTRRPSLDDVYFQLTGGRLEEAA